MGQALYRKYRSKNLAEIVGQEHITDTLSSAIKSGRISHAYLFTGPRGVGKTSIARILAYEINNLPYDSEATHLDIIEIDAASNRRIDEIRDLRDKIHISPASAKYKVYIIDEVHMLTREAFNALLKTLEEPPKHIVFILATTEFHKLPETIVSRTQHYTFRPIDHDKVVAHLDEIAKKEKIKISKDALSIIAQHGGGSFRDSISILDQAKSTNKSIDSADIEQLLGIAPEKSVQDIFSALKNSDPKSLVNCLQATKSQGVTPSLLAKQLAATFRNSLIDREIDPQKALLLLDRLIEVQQSPDPATKLEVVLLEYVFSSHSTSSASSAPSVPSSGDTTPQPRVANPPKTSPSQSISAPIESKPQTAEKPVAKSSSNSTSAPKPTEAKQEQPTSSDEAPVNTNTQPFNKDSWPDVMAIIKQKYNTLYGTLRMAKPEFTEDEIILHFAFAFHQKRLSEPKNKKIIGDAIMHVANSAPRITCVVTESSSKNVDMPESSTPTPEINNISNIFGGAELLES